MARKSPRVRRMRYLMGCFVEIEALSGDLKEALDAVEAAFGEMKRIERALSKYLPDSIVSQINRLAALKPVEVSLEVFCFLEKCLRFSRLADGAFDITVSPYVELWERSCERGELPALDEIREVSSRVGYRHVRLNPKECTIHFSRPNMKIDVGAAGKGYATDRALQILRDQGIEKCLVSTGSTIASFGDEVLRFGIANPLIPEESITSVDLQNSTISTSANYERFFKIRDKNYGHLIDPRTGYPKVGDFLSVSVIGSSAMESDMLSTAVFILGKEKGERLSKSIDGVEGLVTIHSVQGPKRPIVKHHYQLPIVNVRKIEKWTNQGRLNVS